jgi:hypothetical protein
MVISASDSMYGEFGWGTAVQPSVEPAMQADGAIFFVEFVPGA